MNRPWFLLLAGMVGWASAAQGASVTAPINSYFDAAAPSSATGYANKYRVVGTYQPAVSWSWSKIELLEGYQKVRTEGYNLRTQKLRWQDTWEDNDYPLQTYFGELNQELVDTFNLYYKSSCAGSVGSYAAPTCAARGPTRPEARFSLLHHGPRTGAGACDKSKTPVLLVHGAMQNANVWLYPGGYDGADPYPGVTQETGFVQALEAQNHCTYAITFGNFHGDNFSQAINLANALSRVKSLTGRSKVNVVAWSKGVLPVDLYAANVSTWTDWGSRYFQSLAAEQARQVPAFRDDIRTYVGLSGPHLGIDLNFRHPYDDLLIYSTAENAPVGQGPVTWGWMSAVQCVTWGYSDSPNDIFPNPYAYSVCEGRGATWPDYWTRIYSSNITGLDSLGRPVYSKSLQQLNVEQGVSSSSFSFDEYNISMYGSVDTSGKFVSAYLGQLQAAYDLRGCYPVVARDYVRYDWTELDTDKYNWYDWLNLKTMYLAAGYVDSDLATCRGTAFEPSSKSCKAKHTYYNASTADSYLWPYATYRLMDGIGITPIAEMGGNLIARLKSHGLDSRLDFLYLLYGTTLGGEGEVFEIDGLSTPSDADPDSDGVLFEQSIAAQSTCSASPTAANNFLGKGWGSSQLKLEGVPYGHLQVGVTPAVWDKMIAQFQALP